MILTDSMLNAAFKFRETEAWKELTDSDIFAVKLSDGTTVYCSVMGNAGTHHSLGIYIGDEGFATFLYTLAADRMDTIDALSASIEFDCINCDFMQAKDIDDCVKKVIRDYAERNSIKIPRKSGWIDFTRFSPYKGQWNITDEHDAFVAKEALKAATFFAKEFKGKSYDDVYLDPMGKYPTPEGGKQIPLITADESGAYSVSTTTTPPLSPKQYIAPTFSNDNLTSRLRNIKKASNLECRLLHVPTPVKDEDMETPIMPGMFIIVNETVGDMMMPLATQDYPDNAQKLLADLANHLCSLGINPKQITVSDDKTYCLIKDFCRKCDIKLKKAKHMPNLDTACMMMMQGMMMGIM